MFIRHFNLKETQLFYLLRSFTEFSTVLNNFNDLGGDVTAYNIDTNSASHYITRFISFRQLPAGRIFYIFYICDNEGQLLSITC